jgi:membrane protein YqaA with SNARE-associated domain
MNDFSLWGLFLSAFLSSTLLPGGSEAVLAYLTHAQGHDLLLLLAVASAGNTLGGMTSWSIGRLVAIRYPLIASDEGRKTSNGPLLDHLPLTPSLKEGDTSPGSSTVPSPPRGGAGWGDKHRTAVARLRHWGAPVLLLSWLPVIGDPLCVAAGWIKVHWLLSLVLIGIGKTARYAVVITLFA